MQNESLGNLAGCLYGICTQCLLSVLFLSGLTCADEVEKDKGSLTDAVLAGSLALSPKSFGGKRVDALHSYLLEDANGIDQTEVTSGTVVYTVTVNSMAGGIAHINDAIRAERISIGILTVYISMQLTKEINAIKEITIARMTVAGFPVPILKTSRIQYDIKDGKWNELESISREMRASK